MTLIVIAYQCSHHVTSLYWVSWGGALFLKSLVLVSGLTLTVYAGSFLIHRAVRPFLDELKAMAAKRKDESSVECRGFVSGGRVIGRLERALIFFLILTSQTAGVGFLMAAKSIFRFGELKDPQHRMEAEYIIIGTLMSFGYGMLVSYVTKCLLGMNWV